MCTLSCYSYQSSAHPAMVNYYHMTPYYQPIIYRHPNVPIFAPILTSHCSPQVYGCYVPVPPQTVTAIGCIPIPPSHGHTIPQLVSVFPSIQACQPTVVGCLTIPYCFPQVAICPSDGGESPHTAVGCPVTPTGHGGGPTPKSTKPDDLKKIEGVGPKIEEILNAADIKTFEQLSKTKLPKLRAILKAAGKRYPNRDPRTWAKQATMAFKGEWEKLKKWQDELDEGRNSKK